MTTQTLHIAAIIGFPTALFFGIALILDKAAAAADRARSEWRS